MKSTFCQYNVDFILFKILILLVLEIFVLVNSTFSAHAGNDIEILENRNKIYKAAKAKNPNRWSGKTRNWDAVTAVKLNPLKEKDKSNIKEKYQQAC